MFLLNKDLSDERFGANLVLQRIDASSLIFQLMYMYIDIAHCMYISIYILSVKLDFRKTVLNTY